MSAPASQLDADARLLRVGARLNTLSKLAEFRKAENEEISLNLDTVEVQWNATREKLAQSEANLAHVRGIALEQQRRAEDAEAEVTALTE